MPDSVIRVEFVTNADQAIAAIRNVKQQADAAARTSTRQKIDVDDTDARRKLAELQNTYARLAAMRVGVRVDANTDQADLKLAQLQRQTQLLTAETRLVRIQADTGQAEEAVDSLSKKILNVAAYSASYQAFRVFEQAVGSAGQAVIGFNATLEQLQVAFTQSLGSASAANDFLNQLKEFAIRTPFQFGDLTHYAQQLVGMGVAAKDVIPDLTALGNAVAGVGGNADVLQRVVEAFGQISASGRVNARELLRFSEAGIPAYEMLAKALNTDVAGAMKLVTAGAVSSTTAIDALVTGMNDRFSGLMEQQSKTFIGRLSNLKDAFQIELSDLGRPLFEQVSGALDKVAAYLQSGTFKDSFAVLAGDAGQLFTMMEKLFGLFANIPAGAVEFGARFAEIAVAAKAIGAATDLMQRGLTATIATLRGETAATEADTAAKRQNAAATLEQTAANEADARSRLQLQGAVGGRIQAGGAAAAGAAATGLETAASFVAPVTAIATVAFVGASIADQIAQHIEAQQQRAQQIAQQKELKIEVQAALAVPGTAGVADLAHQYDNLLSELQHAQDALAQSSDAAANALGASLQKEIDAVKSAQAQVDPDALQKAATAGLQSRADQALAAVKQIQGVQSTVDIQKTADSAKAAIASMADEYVRAHGSLANFNDELKAINQSIDEQAIASKKALVQQQEQADERKRQAADILDQARQTGLAPPANIEAGLAGTDKASVDQIKLIAEAYKDLTQAQKDWNTAQAAQAAGQKATVDEVLRQWNAVATEINVTIQATRTAVGSIKLDQGVTGLVASADALRTARDSLGGFGQDVTAIGDLARIATAFQDIAKAEDSASDAYKGYLLTLDQTDSRIQMLDAYKKRLDDAVKAAQEAQKAGTATAPQQELIGRAPTALANIAALRQQLLTAEVPDLIGAGENLPNLLQADNAMRDLVGMAGGGKQIRLDVQADTKTVDQQLKDFVNEQRTIDIQLKLGDLDLSKLPAWAQSALGHVPGGGTTPGGYPGGYDVFAGYQAPAGAVAGGYDVFAGYHPPGGGGSLAYAPLAQSQFSDIAGGAPYGNAEGYAALIAAAQHHNIDPRALLAFLKEENTNLPGYNYGGIKYAGQPGSSPGGTSPESDLYARFDSLASFFEAFAANLTTGQYAPLHQAGNLQGIRQQYVAGSAAPSAAQAANIANTVDYYTNLTQQYPSAGSAGVTTPQVPGGGQPYNRISLTQPTPLTGGAGGSVSPSQVAAMRKRANELAGSAYVYGGGHGGQDAGGFDCSGYVIEVLRAGGIPAPFTDAGGLYKWAQTDEGARLLAAAGIQLGFYNPGAGGQNEHVGINIGGEWYESGGQRGNTAGPSPNAAQGFNAFVGTPRAIPGVSGPGVSLAQTTGAVLGQTNLYDPNSPAALAASAQATKQMGDLSFSIGAATTAQQHLNDAVKGLNPASVAGLKSTFDTLLPIMQKIETTKIGPDASEIEKQTAVNTAYAHTADLAAAWADALKTIATGTGSIAVDQQKIADIAGGPVADALNAQLSAMQDIKHTQDQINALTAQKHFLEQQNTQEMQAQQDADRQRQRDQTLQQRGQQDADRATQRSQTLQQRNITDTRQAIQQQWTDDQQALQEADRQRQLAHTYAMRNIQDETTAENDRYTVQSRNMTDEITAFQHYGTVQMQQLQADQRARDDANRLATEGRSAQTQLAQAGARAATTNVGATAAGQSLAALQDAQVTADELYKKQSDDNKKLQDDQTRIASEQLYQLQQEQTAQSRAHDDAINAINDESTQSQRAYDDVTAQLAQEDVIRQQSHQLQTQLWADEDKARQRSAEDQAFYTETQRLAQQRSAEDAQFALESQRIAQQRMYTEAQAALDADITTQQTILTGEQDRLNAAQQALALWQQADSAVQQTAQDLVATITGTPSGLTAKAAGGYVSGRAIVGDSPSGDMSTAEVVTGTFSVLSHTESVRRGFIPGGSLNRYVNGTDATASSGDTYHLTFNASGNAVTDEELFRKLTAWVAARDRAKEIAVRRASLGVRQASQGSGRY